MVRVSSICRKQTLGVTEPYIALLDGDGKTFEAFIKRKGNPQGCLCLINELISYRLAKVLGILMPESGVALIDAQTEDNSFSYEVDWKQERGSCFYSRQIKNVYPLNARAISHVSNVDMFEKIILFDHLIYNKDRNLGNLLLKANKQQKLLYVIDHSHVFKNETIWDAVALRQGIASDDYLDTTILENNQVYDLFFNSNKCITKDSLMTIAKDFQHKITKNVLCEVLKDLPKDWLIVKKDIMALEDYLLYRASHLIDMCEMIMKEKGTQNV